MRALVLCDDYWHPARTPRAGLAPLAERGFAFDWLEDGGAWSGKQPDEYPVIVLTKSNETSATDRAPWMTPQIAEQLRAYVRRGGGLLVIHSGTVGYRDTPTLHRLIGGTFVQHPPQCMVTIAPLGDHPLVAGIAPFALKDEHYHLELCDELAPGDEASAHFLTTTSEHGDQPGGWARTEGAGRVAVLTPGHNVEVWLHPTYQTLIANALRWCGEHSLAER